jgi:signal transduction histidine kinase
MFAMDALNVSTATLTLAALLLAALVLVVVGVRRRLREIDVSSRLDRQALDAVPRAIFIVESLRPGRPNIYVNAAYSALTGFAPHEAVAAGFDALAVFADAEALSALDAAADVSASERVKVRRRDGTTVPARLELRRVTHETARGYVVGLLEPIDDSATAAGRDKDTFWSWLSHELRSPLNACVMWVDVLALSPQQEKVAKAVDAIKRNLARQARLVGELSDAAKISSARLEMRFEPLDFVALVTRELAAWEALATAKQLQFEHRIELDAARVVGDAARLVQTLNHLLESAVASTPTGGRVDLRVYASGRNCVVEITDTGAALSPEDAAHLAVPLWRAPSTTRARAGIGLGIAVAHHVIARHGGALTAMSADKGARFELTMPLAMSDAGTGAVAQTNRTSDL